VAVVVVKLVVVGAYAAFLREKQLRWGALPEEVNAPLPGDDVIPVANHMATRAIRIDVAREAVWPWLAQLGQGRGGFYSYDGLENIAGCQVHSAERIEPQWQDVAVGDDFRLHPEITLQVIRADPPHSLVVAGVASDDAGAEAPYDFSWAFVLVPTRGGATRLVVRERYGYRAGWAPLMVEPLSVVSFVMTQRMLRGIRERAERG